MILTSYVIVCIENRLLFLQGVLVVNWLHNYVISEVLPQFTHNKLDFLLKFEFLLIYLYICLFGLLSSCWLFFLIFLDLCVSNKDFNETARVRKQRTIQSVILEKFIFHPTWTFFNIYS